MKTRFIMKPCYCDRLVKAIDNYIQKADNDLSDLLGKEGYAKPKKTLQYAKGIEDDVADILTEETDYFVREAKASDNLDDLQKRLPEIAAATPATGKLSKAFSARLSKFLPEYAAYYLKKTDKGLKLDRVSKRTTAWIETWSDDLAELMKTTSTEHLEAMLKKEIENGGNISQLCVDLINSGMEKEGKGEYWTSHYRARKVAVTEVLRAHSVAQHEAYMQSPAVESKSWRHTGNYRNEPRQNHVDLISECDNLIDKHNSLMDELDNNTESVHKNKLENLALIARLSELASSTGEAAGKQQEMQAILDELNGSIDGLNMTHEDLTENQDKSLAYIKQMAQEQAKQEAYNEKYQEYVDLIKQQAQEQGELAKVQDEVTAAQQRANDAQKVYQDYVADLYAQDPTGMSTISAQWSEQAANADAAADALQEVLDKQTKLQDAYDETGKKIEEIEEGYTAAADAAKAAAEEGATYGEAISQAYSDVRSDVEKLCQAYDDAYQAAKDSFEGQFDLFDQASTKSSDYLNASVSNAQAALDSQLNYWNTYTANIETLKATSADDLGITEENYKALMSYVQDGSEQAAGLAASMVKSINSGNKDAVAKLADTLADVTAKQDAAAQATADWVTDYENQLDDFQKKMEGTVDSLNLSDEAGKAAKDTIAEYVQKLKDGKKDAVAAAKDVAASVALALQNGSTPSVTTSTTTTVPGHAGGTTDAEDVFVAGENGPELIVGKQGSTVFPTEETDKIVDALNGMEPASDTSNEKKFDQFLQALTGVTVDAPEPGPGESLFDSVLGKVADIVSGKNSDLEAINAAYTGLPGVSTVALPASNAPVAAEAAPLNVQPNAQPAAQESTDATKEINKRVILEIVGNGSVVVSGGSGGGMSEKAVLELLTNNIKPVLMGVIKDEIFEEGQLSYDY